MPGSASSPIKLVVSDFHLGAGRYDESGQLRYTEEFVYDRQFINFLKFHRQGAFRWREVELVINGDFFEMLEVQDYTRGNPMRLDWKLSVERMRQIVSGHPRVFEELAAFAAAPHKSIRMLAGNHDMSLVFPEVQAFLKATIHPDLIVGELAYEFADVRIEHGQQYAEITRFDLERLTVPGPGGREILNHDFSSIMALLFGYRNKNRKYPALYSIAPLERMIPRILFGDFRFALRFIFSLGAFLLRSALFGAPGGLTNGRLTLRRWRALSNQFSADLERAARGMLESGRYRTIVFGHSHRYLYMEYGSGRVYVNTGAWVKQVNLNVMNLGAHVKFCYAHIEQDGGLARVALKEWRDDPGPDVTLFPY